MKIGFRVLFLGIVIALVGLTTQSWAYPVSVGDEVYFGFSLGSGTSPGGPFSVYDSTGTKLFDTFCLERNEYIHLGSQYQYTITGIDDFAAKGGYGGATNNQDFLSDATQWLYWQFFAGTLSDYIPVYTFNTDWGIALQKAFWFLEDEIGPIGNANSVDGYALSLVNLANAHMNDSIGGSVKVMNIRRNGVYSQSQLVATATPEPATLFLLGAGLAGFAGLRLRQK